MPVTSPDNIFYADGSTPLSVESISAAEATSIQEALTNSRAIRSYKWASQEEQDNQIDMQVGDEGFRTDTKVPYRYDGVNWVSTKAFPIVTVSSTGTGAVNTVGLLSPITGLSLSTTIDVPATTKVRVTLSYKGNTAGDAVGYLAGVNITGATTLTLSSTSPEVASTYGPVNVTYTISYITTVNPGNNTFTLLGQAVGSGGARNISYPLMIVEAVQ